MRYSGHSRAASVNSPTRVRVYFLCSINGPLQVCAPGFDGLADEDGLRERDRVGLVGGELRAGL